MNDEIENEKEYKFSSTPEEMKKMIDRVDPEDILPNGHMNRKSHSSYVGMRIKRDDGKYGFSHFEMLQPPKCYVKKSGIHEHGVFAAKDMIPGEVIEEMKTIILDTTENTLEDWVLSRYAILWDCSCDICKKNGKSLFIPTGNGLLYNHSNTPNAYLSLEKPFKRAKIIALSNIKKDEEITWYYGEDYWKSYHKAINSYPRPDVPEGQPGYISKASASEISGSDCSSCGSKNQQPESVPEVQFRSMIVPENNLQ